LQFTFENILILLFSLAAVASAVMMITRRNPVNSALYLIVNFFCISGIYLLLKAQFIAIIQILVYAGAIMVLFLFVIMLLNLQDESKLTENVTYKKISALLLSLLLFSILAITVYFSFIEKYPVINSAAEQMGTIESIGRELYTTFSFPFELVSFVLLAAIIGAIVLAKKKFE
jgi:NADH-quinone oxidoreductase subunit J